MIKMREIKEKAKAFGMRIRRRRNDMAVAWKNPLDIAVLKQDNNTPLIRLEGCIIDRNVQALQRKVNQFYRKKVPRIVLDLSGVSFLNSHGLGVIVYFHTLMQKEGRQLLILNSNIDPSAYLNDLFVTTNLDKMLSIIR